VVERQPRRLLIVAGEASGDRHAARLLEALLARGSWQAHGITGPELEAAGAERVAPMQDLAVIGFTGVIARLPAILRARDRVLAEARRWAPEAALLVDSPGFNFRIGPALHRLGIRVFYYIAPQVWAWHASRARQMAAWVDRLAVVFPFEEALFRAAGVTARFTGHPLIDELAPEVDEPAWRAEADLEPLAPVLGLLPGSRAAEVEHHLPAMLDAAARLRGRHPRLQVRVAAAPGLAPERYARAASTPGVRVVQGRTHALQAYATCCAVASGTATLETALFGTPLVVVYRTSLLNYGIARRVVRLRHIGLPNIVAQTEVAPELLQGALTGERLAAALEPWIARPEARAAQSAALARVRDQLGGPGAAARAAEWLSEMVA
jgi:lipid-A-disaccharide synthase